MKITKPIKDFNDPETLRKSSLIERMINPSRSDIEKSNLEKMKCRSRQRRSILKNYNMTLGEYRDLYLKQKGVCALCGGPEKVSGRLLAIDHDHKTGKVRGLLCGVCNLGLGYYEMFLEKHGTKIKSYLDCDR